ncbi:MAG: type II toxin-antitoxin system antitoxin DNA ADP-ribosyl glycohydrolase DarG [Gemmatimonadaceae bacterium]
MLKFTTGDILRADAEALVNTVNCVGIMGRGIALQFKNAFPENFKAYAAACARHEVQPGEMFVVALNSLTNPRYIINFPTKRHWRGKSRVEDIDAGLKALVTEIRDRGIRSVAVPPLGSGLGGLPWTVIRPRIEETLSQFTDVEVLVFEPHDRPEQSPTIRAKAPPRMTPGRAALVVLMNRYLSGLLDPFVTLLEVHKLMYFMQEAGQELKLRYTKALFGPFAENLSHVLRAVEGYYVTGYRDGGDSPSKTLELVPGAVLDAEERLKHDKSSKRRFDSVAQLVEGFESPFGLELLSSVHWVAVHENANTPDVVVSRVYEWSDRKRRFSPEQIALACKVLSEKGWLDKRRRRRSVT